VRFMPQDLWGALTAPSSSFVAAILVGIPFAALFFVSMKIKSTWSRKLLWIFYVLFLSYLIFSRESGGLIAMYIVFLVAALAMTVFDAGVRKLFYKQKYDLQYQALVGKMDIKKRHKLRLEIKEFSDIIGDVSTPKDDKDAAEKELRKLKKKYGEDLSVI